LQWGENNNTWTTRSPIHLGQVFGIFLWPFMILVPPLTPETSTPMPAKEKERQTTQSKVMNERRVRPLLLWKTIGLKNTCNNRSAISLYKAINYLNTAIRRRMFGSHVKDFEEW
jgi:hypothetical protein